MGLASIRMLSWCVAAVGWPLGARRMFSLAIIIRLVINLHEICHFRNPAGLNEFNVKRMRIINYNNGFVSDRF